MSMQDVLAPLEARRVPLFVVAGLVLSVFAVNSWLIAHAGTSYEALQSIAGPTGFLFGSLGVLGLYRTLIDRTPRLGKIGAAIAMIAAVGWFIITVLGVVEVTGLVSVPSVGPIAIVVFLSILVSYSIAGLSIIRFDTHPTLTGVFVLVPAAMFIVLMARLGSPFVIDTGHTIGHIGVALTLWSQGTTTGRTDTAPDAPA